MDFEKILKRADLNSLGKFIMTGTEDFYENSNLAYSEQIKSTNENICNILKEKCSDFDEFDKIEGKLNEQLYILENIYFEMGILTGVKVTTQILKQIKEL